MNTIASIKNNKLAHPHPQYDVVDQDGEILAHVVRVCAAVPRRNYSNGSNRWDILVMIHDSPERVVVEEAASGTVVGRYCGENVAIKAYALDENAIGSKDRREVGIVPRDAMALEPDDVESVREHLERSWGFVNEEGEHRQIAVFPWKKARW